MVTRRAVLHAAGVGGWVAIAGCLAADSSPDLELEYEIEVMDREDVPEGAREQETGGEHDWAAVEFTVKTGSITVDDLTGLSGIVTDERSEFARGMMYDGEEFSATSENQEYVIEEGETATLYYRIAPDPEWVEWDLGQLESQIDLEATEVDSGS